MTRVSASVVCGWVAEYLSRHLAAHLGELDPVEVWDRLPAPEAFDTVTYPAVAVSSRGITEVLDRRRDSYAGTFGMVVSVWVQELDFTRTTSTTQDYVEAIRSCLLASGKANWRGFTEDYGLIVDPNLSQTLGGGRVSFEVLVDPVWTRDSIPPDASGPLPIVQRHIESVSLKEE